MGRLAVAGSSPATDLLVGGTLAVACGSRGVAGTAFLVMACWAALCRRDLLPAGEETGGKACRGRALVLFFFKMKGLAAEGHAAGGEEGFTREKSEGATLWWAALQAEGRRGEA